MLDAHHLKTVLAAMASNDDGELRRQAERELENLVAELLDHKVRRGLGGADDLEPLAAVALSQRAGLSPAARVLLDRLRYRLAHVAMRGRQWELAAELLDTVLQGPAELTRARLYRTVCTLQLDGSLDDNILQELVQCHRQEGQERPGVAPLDVLVQEATTCLLELMLLCQEADPELLDQLYSKSGRHRTTGLTLEIHTEDGRRQPVEMSEWLAEAHLAEWRREGWLVIDATVPRYGEQGRGSSLKVPGGNVRVPIVVAATQDLANSRWGHKTNEAVQEAVTDEIDDRHLPFRGQEVRWQYVTSAELADHPGRKVIRRNRLEGTWQLIPPYVVVLKDSSTRLRQAVGNFQ